MQFIKTRNRKIIKRKKEKEDKCERDFLMEMCFSHIVGEDFQILVVCCVKMSQVVSEC